MNYDNKQVSVVIPCFNYGKYILEAIDSCLNSTYKNIEIIVVNDGSTDSETLILLETLKKPKTSVIHQENKGVAAARNYGIQKALGDYILPLDADDIIHPTLIEKELTLLYKNPELGFITHWTRLFGNENDVWKAPPFEETALLQKNIVINTSLFRKKAWKDVGGYDESLAGYEDWDFWISLIAKGWKACTIPEVLFYYRRHGISKSSIDKERHQEITGQIKEKHLQLYEKFGLQNAIL